MSDSLEERIRLLQTELDRHVRARRLTWLLLLAAAIVSAAAYVRPGVAAAKGSDAVTVRRIVLTDSKGRIRGSLGVGDDDSGVGLELLGLKGERLAALHVSDVINMDSHTVRSDAYLLLFYESEPKQSENVLLPAYFRVGLTSPTNAPSVELYDEKRNSVWRAP